VSRHGGRAHELAEILTVLKAGLCLGAVVGGILAGMVPGLG
jgi:hypothetical protein